MAAKPQHSETPIKDREEEPAAMRSILRYIRTKVRLSGNLVRDLESRRRIKRRAARRTQHSHAA
jgi:hypothetical protein